MKTIRALLITLSLSLALPLPNMPGANWDTFPAATTLSGTETVPLNQSGTTRYATISQIWSAAPVASSLLNTSGTISLSGTQAGDYTWSGSNNFTGTFRIDGVALGTSAFVDTGTASGETPLNSDLGDAAYKATGTTPGTVAAGDDPRIVNAVQQGSHAVFWIPLSPGDQWTDFELKASTDDFVSDDPNMVFFYHSPDPGKTVITQQVWTNRPDVYFTDSGKTGTPNRRAWIQQTATDSIFALLADANSEVGGFLVIVRDDLSAQRTGMVWSYNLMDGASADNDAAGRSVWRPVLPIRWTNDLDPTIN